MTRAQQCERVVRWLEGPSRQSCAVIAYPGFDGESLARQALAVVAEKGVLALHVSMRAHRMSLDGLLVNIARQLAEARGVPVPESVTVPAVVELLIRQGTAGGCVLALYDFEQAHRSADKSLVQALLDALQSVCQSPTNRTAVAISSTKPLQDVCANLNYSDFWKVCGARFEYGSCLLEDDNSEHFRSFLLEKFRREPTDEEVNAISRLSGGIPGFIQFLADRYHNQSVAGAEHGLAETARVLADVCEPLLTEIEGELTPGELDALRHLALGLAIPDNLTSSMRRLERGGLVAERGGSLSIPSAIVQEYFARNTSQAVESTHVHIRASAGLTREVRELMDRALMGFHIATYEELQARPGEASVYKVTGEDERGVSARPFILKVAQREQIENELAKTREAKQMLGTGVPSVDEVGTFGALAALRLELATSDNRSFSFTSLESTALDDSARASQAVKDALTSLLRPLYAQQRARAVSLVQAFRPPKEAELERLADLEDASERTTGSNIYTSRHQMASIPRSSAVLRENYDLLMKTKRLTSCSMAHGDLNPRNILVDPIGSLFVIDFSTLRNDKPVLLDATRLETELKFSCIALNDESDVDAHFALDALLSEALWHPSHGAWQELPIDPKFTLIKAAATACRESAQLLVEGNAGDRSWQEQYAEGLAAHTLRIALFPDYLTRRQQTAAILSASYLIGRLVDTWKGVSASHS